MARQILQAGLSTEQIHGAETKGHWLSIQVDTLAGAFCLLQHLDTITLLVLASKDVSFARYRD
jgi:hypothetical protein